MLKRTVFSTLIVTAIVLLLVLAWVPSLGRGTVSGPPRPTPIPTTCIPASQLPNLYPPEVAAMICLPPPTTWPGK